MLQCVTRGLCRGSLVAGLLIGTAAAANGVPVSGTVSYGGMLGPVSADQPIVVALSDAPIDQIENAKPAIASVSTNGGQFSFDVAPGTYYLLYFLNHLAVGQPFGIFDRKTAPPGDPLKVSGSGRTDLSLSFDDTALVPGIQGTVTYTGSLGSVSDQSPLIVQRFGDAMVAGPVLSQAVVQTNGEHYGFGLLFGSDPSYLVAYLDLNANRTRDAREPFTIYKDKSVPPADPIVPSATQTDVNIVFGDENAVTATPTPVVKACPGDCNHDDAVGANELVTMVNIALGSAPVADCAAGAGEPVTIEQVLAAVSAALNGCPSG